MEYNTKNKINFISVISSIFILVVYGGNTIFCFGETVHKQVGCDGVELFFTNNSFQEDANNLILKINFTLTSFAVNPRQLYYTGGDCKSISNAIMCLSELYNITCAFYIDYRIDKTQENWFDNSHLGIKCLEHDKWRVWY